MRCAMRIQAPEGKKLVVRIENIDIMGTQDSMCQDGDFLQIFDGPSESSISHPGQLNYASTIQSKTLLSDHYDIKITLIKRPLIFGMISSIFQHVTTPVYQPLFFRQNLSTRYCNAFYTRSAPIAHSKFTLCVVCLNIHTCRIKTIADLCIYSHVMTAKENVSIGRTITDKNLPLS